MWNYNTLSRDEYDDYLVNLTSKTIRSFNLLNRSSFLSLPYTAQMIAFRSHAHGNSDPTKNALRARYQQLQPFLGFNPYCIDDKAKTAFQHTWCRNSTLAYFDRETVVFCPPLAPVPVTPS